MKMIQSRNPIFRSQFVPLLLLLLLLLLLRGSESRCRSGCDLALASYYVSFDLNLTYISSLFGLTDGKILAYNPRIANKSTIGVGSRIDLGFPCDCIGGGFLGQVFPYTAHRGDTYRKIAAEAFANLTTAARLADANSYPPSRIPEGAVINITVICSCGDRAVSNEYGLFMTYPLRAGETLSSVAAENGLAGKEDLLQRYNPSANFSAGEGIVFIPAKDLSGSYQPLPPSTGTVLSGGAIAGIVIAGATLLVLALCLYVSMNRRKRTKMSSLLPRQSEYSSFPLGDGTTATTDRYILTSAQGCRASLRAGITVDKSVEFSYEELSKATNNFSMDNKIGQGGFGSVYYAELREEKAAIKKMDMQASKEFLAELKVLTRVHHLNLVRLIGYCIEDSLFLVYEYIESGNLSQHLRGSGRDPLPWAARMQIALDSARALEYIHEHTVPLYIHRDIKSTNILIDKNFRGKVADFGLAKLTEVGSTSLQTRLVGTFGYMPPEYAQYGDVSAKVDVYAFGVVLYEIISAKEAIVKINESTSDSKGLVILFEEALSKPNPSEDVQKLIDPRLGNNYPIDSVLKIAQLARACTQENPHLRPSMRSIVVALMTLSSTTEDWDVGSLYGNQALVNIVYGR